MSEARKEIVDGVPLLWRSPSTPKAVVIHVPAFGQTKQETGPLLDFLEASGFAAVVIDAFQHGERGYGENREAITRRVFANFRQHMWTIIGMTALDLPSVSRWARQRFGPQMPLHLTGLSMGGDIVVAASPLIDAVSSINAVIATPDWTRPGMRDLMTENLVEQGSPDARARLLYDALDPITHVQRYRDLNVHFIVGGDDKHVPPEAAHRFADAASKEGAVVSVTVKPGIGHLDVAKGEWWKELALSPDAAMT